jgi:O-antigen/teichoic acid export membrane protein
MVMSATDVGFYSIASSWMTLITYVVPVSYVVMYPYFSSLNRERNFRALESSMKYLLIPALPLSLIMSAFSEPIIGIFYGQAFAPAAGALSLLSFVAITIVASQMLLGYFYGIGRPRLYINIILAVFVGSIGLTFFMTASFGIWGAAAAMLVSRAIEVAVLLAAALLSSKSGFGWPGFIKPFIAGIVIYAAALQLSVHGIIELVAYGVILLSFYFAIMLAIKGIDRSDVRKILSWLSRR